MATQITAKKYLQIRSDINDFNQKRINTYTAMANHLQSELDKITDKVFVSFMIGSRCYYKSVVKIGKFYFDGKRKMTRTNGYYCVQVIPAITDRMKSDMISDSYYY